jgi:hypothetical protein
VSPATSPKMYIDPLHPQKDNHRAHALVILPLPFEYRIGRTTLDGYFVRLGHPCVNRVGTHR